MINNALIYAGIGSRRTPPDALEWCARIGYALFLLGYTLRSGGAKGADQAFEKDLPEHALRETFRPSDEIPDLAFQIAEHYHPAWWRCSEYAKRCHARNSLIMLSETLRDPVKFVVCWTPDGEVEGGTGQALRIAEACNIKVFNLALCEPGDVLRHAEELALALSFSE